MIGPGHPLRGGLATFNQRLAKEFIEQGHACKIYSFSLQYPSLLFPGKSQFTTEPAPAGLEITSIINSINPLNWIRVGNFLKNEKYDIVFIRFWIPFMGPALGTILKLIRKNHFTKIICIADNIIPHEQRPLDKAFTRYFLKSCDGFIVMSKNVLEDLQQFEPNKPSVLVPHPLFDNFGNLISKQDARKQLGLPLDEQLILFFGFIRHYKGLDILLKALSQVNKNKQQQPIKLLIAGEFYENEKIYHDLIQQLNLSEQVYLHTHFIPDSEVKNYLCAADVVVQPYRNATQSGVTPLAYYFEKPTIVTNVGGLAAMVVDQKTGIVTKPDATSIANAITTFYELGELNFTPHVQAVKEKYSWNNMAGAVITLADSIKK
jgi:glycosyltransferase involved in cell wall biosynthesis